MKIKNIEMEWMVKPCIKVFCVYFYKQSINNKKCDRIYLGYTHYATLYKGAEHP